VTKVAVVGLAGGTAVTLTGVGDDLGVLDRRKIQTRDSQPYHEAQGMPIAKAERIIADAFDRAVGHATDDLGALLVDVRGRGFEVSLVGISFKAYRLSSSIEARLRSHAMCHGAEGEMTRDALWAACEALGLSVHAEPPGEIPARVDAAGKAIGAPWRKEHKLAALAALAALRGH
jgi:hypothetical protein